jgi:hypothetical protein
MQTNHLQYLGTCLQKVANLFSMFELGTMCKKLFSHYYSSSQFILPLANEVQN